MSTPILPFAFWASGTNQNSIPANDNSLRNQIINGLVISQATTAQPGSPTAGDIYIIAATHTGAQWSTFTPGDLAIYSSGTWYAFAPVAGVVVNVAGALYKYASGAWSAVTASGSVGGSDKQIQYNNAGAIGAEAGFEYDQSTNTMSVEKVTFTGLALTAASATGGSGFRIPHGAAPTSPTNGDVWTTTAGVYARINGVTVGPLASSTSATWGSITGTLSGQTDLQAALDLKQARSPAIQSVASSATVTPTFANDMVLVTAQAAALNLANPTGTAIDGLGIVIRIKDNGTARAITYGTQYRAMGVTLPTTTVISKTVYLAMIFNNTDTKWDVVAVGQQA